MSQLAAAMEKARVALAFFEYPEAVAQQVNGMTRACWNASSSPMESVLVLARTSLSAAVGLADAIGDGLDVTEIHDRASLYHSVAALRAAADIFEAVAREGAQ